jgi:hypothetical protein
MRRGHAVNLGLDVLLRAPPQQQAVALDKVKSAVTVAKRLSTRLVQLHVHFKRRTLLPWWWGIA